MMVASRPDSETSTDVRLSFFGHPRIEIAGRRYEAGLSTMSMAVVALVATAGEPLSRDEAAFTLWPDHLESDARASLRRHIYRINRALPPSATPWVEATSRTVAWAGGDEIDVLQFRRLIRTPAALEEAVALYTADFLPSLDHEWVNRTRAALRREACVAAETAIANCDPQCDPVRTLRLVEALLRMDPWREDAVRALMCLRARMRDRAGALSYFQRFREQLHAEFAVEPLEETTEIYTAIAAGTFAGRCGDALRATFSSPPHAFT